MNNEKTTCVQRLKMGCVRFAPSVACLLPLGAMTKPVWLCFSLTVAAAISALVVMCCERKSVGARSKWLASVVAVPVVLGLAALLRVTSCQGVARFETVISAHALYSFLPLRFEAVISAHALYSFLPLVLVGIFGGCLFGGFRGGLKMIGLAFVLEAVSWIVFLLCGPFACLIFDLAFLPSHVARLCMSVIKPVAFLLLMPCVRADVPAQPAATVRRMSGPNALFVTLAVVIGFAVAYSLLKFPIYVDDSADTVATIGACTYYGCPIPWKTAAPGAGGLLFGLLGLWIPMINWLLFYLVVVVPLRLSPFRTPIWHGLVVIACAYNTVVIPIFGFGMMMGSRL